MNILVKLLVDEYGTREFIFYESGNFSKPLFILTEKYAENLYLELEKIIDIEVIRNPKFTR